MKSLAEKLSISALLMAISPFLSLVVGLRSRDMHYKRWLLVLFITIFGSLIVLDQGTDGLVHQGRVYEYYMNHSFDQFFTELMAMLRLEPIKGTKGDVYIHVLSYLLGTVIGLPGLFHVVVAFVYGYFFSGVIIYLLAKLPQLKYRYLFYFFALIFIIWEGIDGINQFRTQTGIWILVYGALGYYETRKWKYLFLMLLPPLCHVAFLIMALPAWGALLLSEKSLGRAACLIIFVTSFFLNLNNQIFSAIAGNEFGEGKLNAYYVEDPSQKRETLNSGNYAWYRRSQKLGLQNTGILAVSFLLAFGGAYTRSMTSTEQGIFSMGLLTLSLANITSSISALHNRTAVLAGLFIIVALVMFLRRSLGTKLSRKVRDLHAILLGMIAFIFVPFIIYQMANVIYYVSVFMLGLPFLGWFYPEGLEISIRDFLSWIL